MKLFKKHPFVLTFFVCLVISAVESYLPHGWLTSTLTFIIAYEGGKYHQRIQKEKEGK